MFLGEHASGLPHLLHVQYTHTVDRKIYMLAYKIFMLINFRGSFDPQNFCVFFAVGLNHEIILTVKFSWSTVLVTDHFKTDDYSWVVGQACPN